MSNESQLNRELTNLRDKIQRPNILLIGSTGVGKSSLINHIFGDAIAKAGAGRPITEQIEKFDNEESKVVIFDSKGYEVGSKKEQEFISDVIDYSKKIHEIADKIHAVWYLIEAPGARVTDFDINALKRLKKQNLPVSVILSKSDKSTEQDNDKLKQAITKEFASVNIFEVSTEENITGSAKVKFSSELDKLISWTHDILPESLRTAFTAAQKLNLEKKKEEAKSVIYQHTTGAAIVGFTPIPGSDLPILLANQYALLARVLYVFGLDSDQDKYSALIKTAMSTILPTLGKWSAAQIIKLFPGFGTVIGGVINAVVASSLTLAFGYALIETTYRVKKQEITLFDNGNEKFLQSVEAIFNEELARSLDKNFK